MKVSENDKIHKKTVYAIRSYKIKQSRPTTEQIIYISTPL